MSDLELLHEYVRARSQAAFTALVNRYVNLVYSAALRQVRSPHLAEEVTQSVFLELSRRAGNFRNDQPLAAWLYVVTRHTASNVRRQEFRRLTRETTAAEIAAMKTPSASWSKVETTIDEAMETLNDTDRSAIVLRFFENQSLREVGAALGLSEATAQKRISRALDRLRAFFATRGVAATTGSLAVDLSAHAVQTAPIALGPAIATSAHAFSTLTVAASKTLVMTTVQKSMVAAGFALAVGTGLYESNQLLGQKSELAALQRDTADLTAQFSRANLQASTTTTQIAAAREQLAQVQSMANAAPAATDPVAEAEMRAWIQRVDELKHFAQTSGRSIPEVALLSEKEWLELARNLDREASKDPQKALEEALRSARGKSKVGFGTYLSEASRAYVNDHQGLLPPTTRALTPYIKDNESFKSADVTEAMLSRYAIRYTGALADVPREEQSAVIIEITSPDEERDQRIVSGPGGARIRNFVDVSDDAKAALWSFARANGGAKPSTAADLLPYFNPPLSPFRQSKLLEVAPSLLAR